MNLADILTARERIAELVHRTPLFASRSISERASATVRLKAESLQRAGAFKIRGAMNKALSLTEEERSRGLVAFSSGNHAQAVALAARILGTRATIVMPQDSMAHKVAATRSYGADVIQDGNVTVATRGTVARKIADETGATLVPPFDDPLVIAGQGTVGLEIVEDWPEVDTVVVPTGGGGLTAGVALAVTSMKAGVRVFGVEPEAGADGQASLRAGHICTIDPPRTIADGARTIALGELPFAIIRERLEDIVTVPDEALLEAVRLCALRARLVVEPTGALGVAALLMGRISSPGNVAVILSGGNVAPGVLCDALLERG
ncbi:MAG: threonine/serine dehydratase [Deltaproteobacteria bacterium]|nr:threonine/serine dehydratase [Deltaproteobacteria bacterium]